GRLEYGSDRGRDVAEEKYRLAAEFADLADRLRRALGRRPGHEEIGAGIPQRHDLRVEGGIRDLIGFVGDDHAGFVAETVAQSLHLVLAGVVILPDGGDLAVRIILQDVGRINSALALVVGLPAHGPRKILRIAP